MRPIGFRLLALTSVSVLAAISTESSTRPRYGGTLRVELHAAAISFDPREWKAGSTDAAESALLAGLVFERLVTLDNYGRFQPGLATTWTHDAEFKRWQFTLRSGVKFTDESSLTAADVVGALEPLLPSARKLSASGNTLVLHSASAVPELLEELSSGRYFIYRVQTDGPPIGTGPFALERTESSGDGVTELKMTRYLFRAHEESWGGRPFLDRIDVTLGLPPLRRLYDLQLGKADLIELAPDLVRRAMQSGLRTWASYVLELYAIRWEDKHSAANDDRLRAALAAALDRATMGGVLLQKQAEPAESLLPQWLSGYAFLFAKAFDPEGAARLRKEMPATLASAAQPLRLRVEAPGDVARLLGDRVAVNARQTGIIVQVENRGATRAGGTPADSAPPALHLIRWHFDSLSARDTLEALGRTVGAGDWQAPPSAENGADELYAREQRLLDEHRVIPLVAVPQFVGLGANVRNWMPAPWGEWRAADVWLDSERARAGSPAGQGNSPGEKP